VQRLGHGGYLGHHPVSDLLAQVEQFGDVVPGIDEAVSGKELVPVQGNQGVLQFDHPLVRIVLPFAADWAVHKNLLKAIDN
jgi:hypothetical protein